MAAPVPAARLDVAWSQRLDDFTQALAWLPDGRALVALEGAGGIVALDAATGAVTRIGEHENGAMDVAIRADGRLVATCGQDGCVALWSAVDWSEQHRVSLGRGWVEHLAWQPNGKLLAATSGRRLVLLDADGTIVHELAGHGGTITAIRWVPNGRQIAVAALGGVTIHALERDRVTSRLLAWQGAPLTLSWSPDGRTIACGLQDGTVHFWRLVSGADSQMAGYETKVRATGWSANSRLLATAGGSLIVVWDFGGKGPEGTKPVQLQGHTDRVTALAWQSQGAHLASGGHDWRLSLWRPALTDRALDAHLLDSPASALAWSADTRRLAAGTESGEVTVYDLAK